MKKILCTEFKVNLHNSQLLSRLLLKLWHLGFVYMELILLVLLTPSLAPLKVKIKKSAVHMCNIQSNQKNGHALTFSLIFILSNSWDWYKDVKTAKEYITTPPPPLVCAVAELPRVRELSKNKLLPLKNCQNK